MIYMILHFLIMYGIPFVFLYVLIKLYFKEKNKEK